MIDGIVDSFRQCRTDRDYWRVQLEAEHRLTPGEFAGLLALKERLPAPALAWLEKIAAIGRFAERGPVEEFKRSVLGDYVNLYGDPRVSSNDKRLIIGFCGLAHQLMLPIPCMLQYLAPAKCDVLVLRDPDREHYYRGISGYASSFLELLRRISRDVPLGAYRRVYCYGTSVGGSAAMRAGLLLEIDRAIAIGASFPWHVSRLQDAGAWTFPAFDPICNCWRNTDTVLLSAYGGANQKDREEGEKLAAVLPVRSIVFPDVDTHNLILALADSGRLDVFFDRIFQVQKDLPERKPPRAERNWISRLLPWSTNAFEAAPGPSRRRPENKPRR